METHPLLSGNVQRTPTMEQVTQPPLSNSRVILPIFANAMGGIIPLVFLGYNLATKHEGWEGKALLAGAFLAWQGFNVANGFWERKTISNWQAQRASLSERFQISAVGNVQQARLVLQTPPQSPLQSPAKSTAALSGSNSGEGGPQGSSTPPYPETQTTLASALLATSPVSTVAALSDGETEHFHSFDEEAPQELDFAEFVAELRAYKDRKDSEAGFEKDLDTSFRTTNPSEDVAELITIMQGLMGNREAVGYLKGIRSIGKMLGVNTAKFHIPDDMAHAVRTEVHALQSRVTELETELEGKDTTILHLQSASQSHSQKRSRSEVSEQTQQIASLKGQVSMFQARNKKLEKRVTALQGLMQEATDILSELFAAAFLKNGTAYPDIPEDVPDEWRLLFNEMERMVTFARQNTTMHQSFNTNVSGMSGLSSSER